MKKYVVVFVAMLALVGCAKSNKTELYQAGTYQASAKGLNGDVVVSVTLSTTDITNIEIVEHSETAGISDPAFEEVPKAILEEQSTEVDGVSGVTYTSNAIKEAVSMILADNAKQD